MLYFIYLIIKCCTLSETYSELFKWIFLFVFMPLYVMYVCALTSPHSPMAGQITGLGISMWPTKHSTKESKSHLKGTLKCEDGTQYTNVLWLQARAVLQFDTKPLPMLFVYISKV